jgi:hypothetical protein
VPVVLALRRERQEDLKFNTRLGYLMRFCLKKKPQFFFDSGSDL